MTKKIEPPEKGTTATETFRTVVDAGLNAIPFVGGSAATIGRHVVPSRRDKKTSEFHEDVAGILNDHTAQLTDQSQRIDTSMDRMDGVEREIEGLQMEVARTAVSAFHSRAEPDFYDGALEACRTLVEQRKFETASALLESRAAQTGTNAPAHQLMAAIRNLQGVCQLNLGEHDRAAVLFFEARDLDPLTLMVKNNVVTALLLKREFEEAIALTQDLLALDPSKPRHWANFIYANGAAGGSIEVPPEHRSTEMVMLASIEVLRGRDDLEWHRAAQVAEDRHPASRPARRYAAEAKIDRTISVIQSDTATPEQVTAARCDASEAGDRLAELWSQLLTTEVPAKRIHLELLQNALTGLIIAERAEEAFVLAQTAFDALRRNAHSRGLIARLALMLGHLDLVEDIFTTGPCSEVEISLMVELLVRRQDWAEAERFIEDNADALRRPGEVAPDLLAELMRAAGSPDGHRVKAFDALARRDLDAVSLLMVSRIARRTGVRDLAELALRRALDRDGEIGMGLRRQLAIEAHRFGTPEDVIVLLDGHVDVRVPSDERQWLAVAYAQAAQPLVSGLAFFDHARSHARDDATVQRAGGFFELMRSQPDRAIPWFRRALDADPEEVQAILALWQAFGHTGQKSRAHDLLRDLRFDDIHGPAHARLQLAQLLWRQGRTEVLDAACEIVLQDSDNEESVLAFFGLILMDGMLADAPSIPPSETVAVGTWVRLERMNGDPFEFVATQEKSGHPGHLPASHTIVSTALGKRVGETFVVLGREEIEWRICEIKPRIIHLFHELTHSYANMFPKSRAFYSVSMDENDVEPVLQQIRDIGQGQAKTADIYLEKMAPLGMIAQMTGTSLLEAAARIRGQGRLLRTATGLQTDQDADRAVLDTFGARPLVLDSITAWHLAQADLLPAIGDAAITLLIPGSAVAELSGLVETVRGGSGERMSLHAVDGQVFRHIASAEEIEESATAIEETIRRIVDAVQVVGTEVPDDLLKAERKLLEYGAVQFDTLSVAIREGGVVLSLDLHFRQVVRELVKREAVGITDLLPYLADHGQLDDVQQARIQMDMACEGFGSLGFTGKQLYEAFRLDTSRGHRRFEPRRVCRRLIGLSYAAMSDRPRAA